jgi:hypothetical protein
MERREQYTDMIAELKVPTRELSEAIPEVWAGEVHAVRDVA